MNWKALLLTALLCVPLLVPAQDKGLGKKAERNYQSARDYINRGQYPQAVEALLLTLQEAPAFAEAYRVLGDVFRIQGDYPNAVLNYRKLIELEPAFSPQTWYGLGFSLYHSGEYGEAAPYLERYLQEGRPDTPQLVRVKKLLANCNFATEAMKSPVPFEAVNLGPMVNSPNDEYLPAVTVDGKTLVFTRKDKQGEDFYLSTGTDEGRWSAARPLSPVINSAEYNEGAECLAPDGQTIYFTICGKPGGMGSCDIYYSRLEGNEWTAPLNLGPPVNTPAWESQPSLSPDGRTLYFASNRSGTLGGIDLWKTVRQEDGSWSSPVNLGPQINTPWEEQSPFIHPDNQTLYFSSEGWPGMGGKDIFFSKRKGDQWEQARNLGYPINTLKDESSLVVSADGETAYFASNSLQGEGGYDLYTFSLPAAARPAYVSYVRGKVYDEASGQALEARVDLIDLENREKVFGSFSNTLSGEFLASLPSGNNYAMNVSRPGYLFYSGSFFLENQEHTEPVQLDIPLRKIAAGESIVLENIFFETASYRLKPESYPELDKVIEFMKQNPRVVVELAGHTDDVGSEADNLQLSENRAKVVYAYLLRGLPKPERFRYKGYGESRPLAGNDTEEGRARNRRTELQVISE